MRVIRRIFFYITYPIHKPVQLYLRAHPQSRRYIHATVGLQVAFFGAWLATHTQDFMPHFMWDGLCYAIHGAGAAPAFKLVMDWLKIEI